MRPSNYEIKLSEFIYSLGWNLGIYYYGDWVIKKDDPENLILLDSEFLESINKLKKENLDFDFDKMIKIYTLKESIRILGGMSDYEIKCLLLLLNKKTKRIK